MSLWRLCAADALPRYSAHLRQLGDRFRRCFKDEAANVRAFLAPINMVLKSVVTIRAPRRDRR